MRAALKQEIASGVTVTEVAQWRVLGTPVARVGAREIVTGAHRYPSDIVRPGMLYGRVLRPPSFGAKLEAIDLAPARAMEGVVAVRDGDFVAVAAPTSFAAERARTKPPKPRSGNRRRIHRATNSLPISARTHRPSPRPNQRGTPDEALKSASKVLRETYTVAYIQHAPMEPRAAVAEWSGDDLTVWTGSQQPSRVRQDLSREPARSGRNACA